MLQCLILVIIIVDGVTFDAHVVPWHDAAQVRAHGVQAEVLDVAVVSDDEVRRVRLQAMHSTSIQQSGTISGNEHVLMHLTSTNKHALGARCWPQNRPHLQGSKTGDGPASVGQQVSTSKCQQPQLAT